MSYPKDDALDFVLWKASKPGRAVVGLTGTGPGRPGWHLECSAMALRSARVNLRSTSTPAASTWIFPHHENEIAQSEGVAEGTVLALLVPHRAPVRRKREDVEVALLDTSIPSRSIVAEGFRAVGASLPAVAVALPQAAELHLGEPEAEGRVAHPPAHSFLRRRHDCGGDLHRIDVGVRRWPGRARRSREPSRTISTRRRRGRTFDLTALAMQRSGDRKRTYCDSGSCCGRRGSGWRSGPSAWAAVPGATGSVNSRCSGFRELVSLRPEPVCW